MDARALPMPEHIGGYRILGELGAGAQGRVFKAESDSGALVALKQLGHEANALHDPQRFVREVANLKAVHGLYLARFIDSDVRPEADPKWLATEFIDGPHLDDLIEKKGAFTPAQAAYLGGQIAEGLSHIHRYSLLHRDLKPANIVVGPDGPNIIDFGLSILTDKRGELTSENRTVGTEAWLPPEQFLTSSVTSAADIYALGLIITFMVTVERPYRGRTSLDGVEKTLAGILSDMLDQDYYRRPDADEAKSRLLSYAERGTTQAAVKREQRKTILPPRRDHFDSAERPKNPSTAAGKGATVATSTSKSRRTVAKPTRKLPSPRLATQQANRIRKNYAAQKDL